MKVFGFAPFALGVLTAMSPLAGCGGSQSPSAQTEPVAQTYAMHNVPWWRTTGRARAACEQVVGKPACLALIAVRNGRPLSGCDPSNTCGWTPQQLETAYGLTSSLRNGSGTKVAVVEVGDDAEDATSFSTYRSEYDLGAGTLEKYNEEGQQSNFPDSCEGFSWCVQTDGDIEMISASCPKCTVVLVEAASTRTSDFEAAEAEAAALGATIVSNSWICYGSSDCGDAKFKTYFDAKGVAYLASTGDDGYEDIGAPSVLDSVIAVGGTQLSLSGSEYSETLWTDAGAGCADSAEVGMAIPKPAWQHDPDCSSRTVADVSAEAGCSPGVATYSAIYGEWFSLCGTSVAAPFTAGVIGIAGNADKQDGGANFWELDAKQHKPYFHHPTGGPNSGNYINGDGRYDKYYSGPGGWGTPNGIKAY